MANDREPAIGEVWRQQPPEGRHSMSLDEIRTKAGEFDRKVTQWQMVGGLTMSLLLVKNAWEVWVDTDLAERAGDLLMLVALLYVAFRFLGYARASAPAALGQTSCLEHYRARLRRQRDLSQDGWKFALPFVPGFALIIAARALDGRPPAQVAMLIAFAVAILAGILWVNARSARQLDRELSALD